MEAVGTDAQVAGNPLKDGIVLPEGFRLSASPVAGLGRQLQRVYELSVREVAGAYYTSAQIEAWLKSGSPALWEDMGAAGFQFFLVFVDRTDELAAFLSVNAEGYVHALFVHPRFVRKGLATSLLDAARTYAARHGASGLHAEVSRAARAFFEKQGFRVEKREVVLRDGEALERFLMRGCCG